MDLLSHCHGIRTLPLVPEGLAAMMGIAGQRAKQGDSIVKSGSSDKSAAELADGVDEGDMAGVIDG